MLDEYSIEQRATQIFDARSKEARAELNDLPLTAEVWMVDC
jgi:hypothetical protein